MMCLQLLIFYFLCCLFISHSHQSMFPRACKVEP